jgi:O-antigen ligase
LRQFFGTDGRNNGLLTNLSLAVIFTAAANLQEIREIRRILYGLLFGGLINVAYGTIQLLGKDFIPWNNLYGPVVGTLGNPNFMSSFLGMCLVGALSLLSFSNKREKLSSTIIITICFVAFFVILKTGSIQGLIVVFLGILIALFLKLKIYKIKWGLVISFAFFFPLLILLVLGFSGRGFLSQYLYQSTLQVRFYFWEAALNMLLAKPFTGVGIDSFGDWYRYHRSEEAYGSGLLTNSAHNVFLDYAAYGGFSMLITYLVLQLLVLLRIIKHLKDNSDISKEFIALVAVWMAYQLQSLISINNIVITSFGWIISGCIYALTSVKVGKEFNQKKFSFNLKFLTISVIGALIGFFLTFQNFRNDSNFRKALSEKEGSQLIAVVKSWPLSQLRLNTAAGLLIKSGYYKEGRALIDLSLDLSPGSVETLSILLEYEGLTRSEEVSILEKIAEIDPWNMPIKERLKEIIKKS